MNYLIALSFCVILITDAFAKKERIVGGSSVDIRQYPFQTSLRIFSSNQHFCGGTIITQKYVISSAHCLIDYKDDYSDIRVYTGSNSPTYVTASYAVEKVDIHPLYTGKLNLREAFLHDISIIKVVGTIRFNQNTNKARLPNNDININDIVDITGYGKINAQAMTLSTTLQKVQMRIVDLKSCTKSLKRRIQKKQGCLKNQIGIGACHGDSGGPVSKNGVLIGILSFVVPCAQDYPDVFVNVYSYLEYIYSIVPMET